MAVRQVVAHYGGKDLPDGVPTPFYAKVDGVHKKVGDVVFDKKNSFITAQVDTETEEGKLLLQGLFRHNIRVNNGQNED